MKSLNIREKSKTIDGIISRTGTNYLLKKKDTLEATDSLSRRPPRLVKLSSFWLIPNLISNFKIIQTTKHTLI